MRSSLFILFSVLLSFPGYTQETRYVNASSLNVRDQPTTDGNVIGKILRNDEILILEFVDEDWCKIETGRTIGYVATRYLSENKVSVSTEAKVYICVSKSAYAYHSYQCHGFNRCRSPRKYVLISEARSMGYRPCKICY